LQQALEEVLPSSIPVTINTASSTSTNSPIMKKVNHGFDIVIGITMFLCLFSLSANVSANVFE